jgi:predicted RNA-binding protein with PIN domain
LQPSAFSPRLAAETPVDMPLHIIIDGYNLIRQSSRLSALEDQDIQFGRDALIEDLAAYKRLKSHRITVVFDGANAPPAVQGRSRDRGIDIRFSRSGELADDLINKMVLDVREQALVVSSDQEVAGFALDHGAAAISSPEFETRLSMAAYMDMKGSVDESSEGWVPTTKKKGPRRRLPKKARRLNAKTKKL